MAAHPGWNSRNLGKEREGCLCLQAVGPLRTVLFSWLMSKFLQTHSHRGLVSPWNQTHFSEKQPLRTQSPSSSPSSPLLPDPLPPSSLYPPPTLSSPLLPHSFSLPVPYPFLSPPLTLSLSVLGGCQERPEAGHQVQPPCLLRSQDPLLQGKSMRILFCFVMCTPSLWLGHQKCTHVTQHPPDPVNANLVFQDLRRLTGCRAGGPGWRGREDVLRLR